MIPRSSSESESIRIPIYKNDTIYNQGIRYIFIMIYRCWFFFFLSEKFDDFRIENEEIYLISYRDIFDVSLYFAFYIHLIFRNIRDNIY